MRLKLLLAIILISGYLSTPVLAADRLITVGGSVTETVFALGKGDEIVADDITSYYPEPADKLPKVGYMRTLSAEGILSLKPTFILADGGAGPVNVLDQIRSAGVRVIQMKDGHSPTQVAANIRLIGQAINAKTTEDVAKQYESAWQQADTKVAALKGNPRVLFVLDHTGKSPQAAGNDTAANAMISLARATNVMASQFNGYKPLTAESIVAAAPDVIITTTEAIEASGGIEAFLSKPGLSMTPAGKAKRVVSFDSLYLLGFTPRLPDAVLNLATAIRKP
jgi:iron complex transport system substrate-binding protein